MQQRAEVIADGVCFVCMSSALNAVICTVCCHLQTQCMELHDTILFLPGNMQYGDALIEMAVSKLHASHLTHLLYICLCLLLEIGRLHCFLDTLFLESATTEKPCLEKVNWESP